NHLYIVGGGHCALAFSKLMSMMDFYIHLFEEREGLNTMAANNYAHEKNIVNDYSELKTHIPAGENNYVVVMTFGYRTDDIAVRALLNKNFKYFGLLGSKKKIEKMFEDYKNEGTDEKALRKIHSPIGIQIKSQTPEEIAISIAAEIIKVKNEY
ncbi:MAG TPA: XdhC family protein, partial [Chitinophagaceae bacterium]|nr:XdhC family protein [Chitinophagaceae bacterium]